MATAAVTTTWNQTYPAQNSTYTYGSSYGYNSQNFSFTNSIIVTVTSWILFCVICCASRYYANHCSNNRSQQEENADADAAAASRNNHDKKLDKEARLEFVKFNLPYRTMDMGKEDGGDEETGEAQVVMDDNTSHRRRISGTTSQRSLSDDDDDDDKISTQSCVSSMDEKDEASTTTESKPRPSFPPQDSSSSIHVCSICLSGYCKGDQVAWSTNPTCPHEYHRECIQNWLLSHEECPMCRNIFLVLPDEEAPAVTNHSTELLSTPPVGTLHTTTLPQQQQEESIHHPLPQQDTNSDDEVRNTAAAPTPNSVASLDA